MKKFVLAHYGYETPTQEIMDAWGAWFASYGDKIVETVGTFGAGIEISHAGSRDLPLNEEGATGYSIIEAESLDAAVAIAKDCPFITSIRVYEVMTM